MKKTTAAAALLVLSLGLGCQDRHGKQHVKAGKGTEDLEVFSNDEVQEVPETSDLDFEQAVEAYQAGDHAFAARRIEQGIAALKAEPKDNTGALPRDTQAVLRKLEDLAGRVRKGQVKSLEELRNTFNQAELLVVHSYFVLSNFYLDRSSDNQAAMRMGTLLKKLEDAVRHGDDRLKAEAQPLIAQTHRLIRTEKAQERLDRERLRQQTDKLIDFLERHTGGKPRTTKP